MFDLWQEQCVVLHDTSALQPQRRLQHQINTACDMACEYEMC